MHLVILLYSMFASLFTLQKSTLQYSEPFFLIGSRMLFAGLILIGYLAIRQRDSLKVLRAKHIGAIALLTLSNIYLTNIFEIWAINNMVSSKACLVYSLSPFVSALIAFVVLKERLSNKKILGMLIGFFGLAPILFMQTQAEISSGKFLMFTFAELSIIAAVFSSVYGWIMLKKVIQDYQYSPLLANGLSMALGGTLALMHSYFSGENWAPVPVNNMQPFIINTLIMCIISNLVCYNLYGYLLKRFSATFMSFAGLITPIFASIFGFVFLKEAVSWQFYISIVLFSIGLFIFYREEIAKDETDEIQSA